MPMPLIPQGEDNGREVCCSPANFRKASGRAGGTDTVFQASANQTSQSLRRVSMTERPQTRSCPSCHTSRLEWRSLVLVWDQRTTELLIVFCCRQPTTPQAEKYCGSVLQCCLQRRQWRRFTVKTSPENKHDKRRRLLERDNAQLVEDCQRDRVVVLLCNS